MAQLIDLQAYTDKRGNLVVVEKIPFNIKRIAIYIFKLGQNFCNIHGINTYLS